MTNLTNEQRQRITTLTLSLFPIKNLEKVNADILADTNCDVVAYVTNHVVPLIDSIDFSNSKNEEYIRYFLRIYAEGYLTQEDLFRFWNKLTLKQKCESLSDEADWLTIGLKNYNIDTLKTLDRLLQDIMSKDATHISSVQINIRTALIDLLSHPGLVTKHFEYFTYLFGMFHRAAISSSPNPNDVQGREIEYLFVCYSLEDLFATYNLPTALLRDYANICYRLHGYDEPGINLSINRFYQALSQVLTKQELQQLKTDVTDRVMKGKKDLEIPKNIQALNIVDEIDGVQIKFTNEQIQLLTQYLSMPYEYPTYTQMKYTAKSFKSNELYPWLQEVENQDPIQLKFQKKLQALYGKIEYFDKKFLETGDTNYSSASDAAVRLYMKITLASAEFLSTNRTEQDYTKFVETVQEPIREARLVLDKFRDSKKLIANIVALIVALPAYIAAAVYNVATKGRFTFFSTDSSEKIGEIEDVIKHAKPSRS